MEHWISSILLETDPSVEDETRPFSSTIIFTFLGSLPLSHLFCGDCFSPLPLPPSLSLPPFIDCPPPPMSKVALETKVARSFTLSAVVFAAAAVAAIFAAVVFAAVAASAAAIFAAVVFAAVAASAAAVAASAAAVAAIFADTVFAIDSAISAATNSFRSDGIANFFMTSFD